MTIKIAINIENAHGWHIGNNIFVGTSGKKTSGSSSEDNLNDADFEEVDEDEKGDEPDYSQKVPLGLPFAPQIPKELTGEKATRIFLKLYKKEILDENFQPLNLSACQKAYLAYQIACKLNINHVWKVFSEFWHMKPSVMRTRYNDAISSPSIAEFYEEIKECLQ